ncbi:hypothetical protein M408DRAFT_331530 [Serendipita vermifera MAFF 305830]|uniref:NEDD8-activating enzyme E1 regulatory subunit n=1 Tax=Serendipita vermifera MAFF 305830 TaxID=933852 RepID=A0A0C2WEH6_SERVB|nr:hypothetical protein M408DRAFT_331530 [Serendipita vermifera MAFF 305830]
MSQIIQTGPPDAKTRKYDRQLRLWAATGQSALESARLLVIGATATSTSVLKNLVLPGIGHFTILDPNTTTPEDVGNNFFLEIDSIGKQKAVEAARLLSELNESVQIAAEPADIADILATKPEWISNYTMVIAHNLPRKVVDKLAAYLWSDRSLPALIVVKTAGFLAEFYLQCHEHTVIDSHSEEKVSLRIDNPFPALLEKATSIDLSSLDQTTHSHIPFIYILIQAAAQWRAKHNNTLPKTFAERKAFQKFIDEMKMKADEENFDEAAAQAFRVAPQPIPTGILKLFDDPALNAPGGLTRESKPFFHLLAALKEYVLSQEEGKRTLPLSANLPDIKSDTKSYVEVQTLYKQRAREERGMFKAVLVKRLKTLDPGNGSDEALLESFGISEGTIDDFVKNSHGLTVLRSTVYGAIDKDPALLDTSLSEKPRETAVHIAFTALDSLPEGTEPTVDNLRAQVVRLLGKDAEIGEDVENCIGEIARTPTADLPTTAGFVGGLVAQEAIKLITKQYLPQVGGHVVVDLIGSWTGIVP